MYTQVKAEELKVGDRIALYGPGYRVRTVTIAPEPCEEKGAGYCNGVRIIPNGSPVVFEAEESRNYTTTNQLYWKAIDDEHDYTRDSLQNP